jgi:hypothetical protein
MTDDTSIKIISEKSKELLERQIGTYRSKQDKATTILGLLSLFLPLYLFIIEKSSEWTKLLSIIPLTIMTWGTILIIRILKTQKLNQGYNPDKFPEFINWQPREIYLYEIASNKLSFEDNDVILEKQNNNYNKGIKILIISIGLSISLLLFDIGLQTIKSFNNGNRKSTSSDTTNIKHTSTANTSCCTTSSCDTSYRKQRRLDTIK